MSDCISRQEVLHLIGSYGGIDYKARQDMLKIIQNKPSVTPTQDCISRQAVLDLAEKGIFVGNHNYKSVCNAINALPSVTPTERTGHWSHDGSHWKNRFICSECNYKLFDEPTNYCPNCGARMVGDAE